MSANTGEVVAVLACGCRIPAGESGETPVCTQHCERRVRRVVAPPPRILAVNCQATGPYVRAQE